MKSKATTVEEYLAEVPEEQRPALETLRELCLDELTGYEEGCSTECHPTRETVTPWRSLSQDKRTTSRYTCCERV